jgi:hypothetical protein
MRPIKQTAVIPLARTECAATKTSIKTFIAEILLLGLFIGFSLD